MVNIIGMYLFALVMDMIAGKTGATEKLILFRKKGIEMLEKIAGAFAFLFVFGFHRWIWDTRDMLEIIAKYWFSNYRIDLKRTPKENIIGATQVQFLQHTIDSGKMFHVILLINHIVEILSLGTIDFIIILIKMPNSLIWGILELILINKTIAKIIKELEITNRRFDEDGIFFLDLDKLGDSRKPILSETVCM